MLSLYSQRLITASTAALLLSLNVNAMGVQDQLQQKCTKNCGLEKPCVAPPSASCIQTRNEVTLSLVGATTVNVRQLKTLQCQIVQTDCDSSYGSDTYPVDKVCGPDESQSGQQKGYCCGNVGVTPIQSSWSKKAGGTKTGLAEYAHLTEYELKLNGGDSCHQVLPCEKVSTEDFLKSLPRELQRNFDLNDVGAALDNLIKELERNDGTLTVKDSKKHQKITKNK